MTERITRLNECKVELGRFGLEELTEARQYILARIQQARTELNRVDDEIMSRYSYENIGQSEIGEEMA